MSSTPEGTGLSDRVAGERLPTLEERIDDLRAVLDAVESERTVIVCFADSGPLGCLFAATYPASQRPRLKGLSPRCRNASRAAPCVHERKEVVQLA